MTTQKNNKELIISTFLLAVSGIYLLYVIIFGSSVMNATFDPVTFKRAYEESQWMVPNSKKPIGDNWFYAYSGYKLINGENPILISPEVPPAGKYLRGRYLPVRKQ